MKFLYVIFFFQAEDGIRDGHVTGVQTCALPIWVGDRVSQAQPGHPLQVGVGAQQGHVAVLAEQARGLSEIGRASWRENVKVKPCLAGRNETKAKVEAPMKLLDEIHAYQGQENQE